MFKTIALISLEFPKKDRFFCNFSSTFFYVLGVFLAALLIAFFFVLEKYLQEHFSCVCFLRNIHLALPDANIDYRPVLLFAIFLLAAALPF